MAEKFAQYEAKNVELRPTDIGYSAREQAGRRIGPFATQAAAAVRQVANLSADMLKSIGQQQTAFDRFEGAEGKERGGGVKYGGGLKDMFQLGAGGNEPNYARLNRVAELQDGSLAIARQARRLVRAQSPIARPETMGPDTYRKMTEDADWWKAYQAKGAIQPIPDTSNMTDTEAQKAWENYRKGQPNEEPSRDAFDTQVVQDWAQGAGQIWGDQSNPMWQGTGRSMSVNPQPDTNTDMWPQTAAQPVGTPGGTPQTTVGPDLSGIPAGNTAAPAQTLGSPDVQNPAPSTPPDPSQNPNAPPIYDILGAGF